jgi:hypothetical protein
MCKVMKLLEEAKPVTLKDIMQDLYNDNYEALYFVTEEQIEKIDALEKYDNIMSRWMDAQEELLILSSEFG